MEGFLSSSCKTVEGQLTYIICKYQYTDPITETNNSILVHPHYAPACNVENNSPGDKQNNIPLTNIIAYLTQKRTFPFAATTTTTKSHGELPKTPLISFLQRMRDSSKNYLLLKSLHNSYAQKLQQQQQQQQQEENTNTNNKNKVNAEVKKDNSAHAFLTTGSSDCRAKQTTTKAVHPFDVLKELINLTLNTKTTTIVDKPTPAPAPANELPIDELQQEREAITNDVEPTAVLALNREAIDFELTTASDNKMETQQQQQQEGQQQTLSEAKKMSTKDSIAKMSLNLNGTTDAGNGKAIINKKTVLTPKTPKTPLEHHTAIGSKATTPAGKCEPIKKDKQKTSASPGATVSFDAKLTPKTPPVTPDSPYTYIEDDMNSVYSFATTTSGRSTMSCEHPYVALNGTTFSGRKMKYVVHCSAHAGQIGPDYLTPTQRAQRQLRRLKEVLSQARQNLEQKDSEIVRLTREVVELRLFKASLSSPDERSASSDAITVREAELKTSQDVSPIIDMVDEAGAKTTSSSPRHLMHAAQQSPHSLMHSSTEMHSSCADSGNFEDMTSSSVHSKDDSYQGHTHDVACGSDELTAAGQELAAARNVAENFELQRQELIRMYEQKIEELIRSQDAASSEVKRMHNDKMEALLMKLADCNTRYADIVPDYEHAKERIRELESQLEDLQQKLADHEDKQKKLYLHMYQKGQEAERINRADQALEMAKRQPNSKVSVSELLLQLQNTQDELENIRASEQCRVECGNNHALLTAKEAISLWVVGARKTIYKRLLEAQKNRTHVDPEVTLQFLKSAVYYFLTDKENSQGHLQAIESILEFTDAEKQNISKARSMK